MTESSKKKRLKKLNDVFIQMMTEDVTIAYVWGMNENNKHIYRKIKKKKEMLLADYARCWISYENSLIFCFPTHIESRSQMSAEIKSLLNFRDYKKKIKTA